MSKTYLTKEQLELSNRFANKLENVSKKIKEMRLVEDYIEIAELLDDPEIDEILEQIENSFSETDFTQLT